MINEDNPTRREREWLKNSSPKSYVRCVACNANSWYFPERKFFRFPKDPERSKEWAIACGKRFLLDMSPSDLYKKCRVCSAHFVDSDFCTLKKHFLHLRAKPRKFSKTENCGKTYLNNFECSRLQLNSPDSSSSINREVLIERVKSYPVLYNPLHKDYADVEMKENIWSKIAQQLKCASGYKVEEQWLRLRKGYKSALRRQKMKGNGRCETKKCWAYEKQMGFLLPFLTDRSVSPSVQKTADGKMSRPFQEECNAQDEDSSSSSIITCDDAFNNHYLSERSLSKTYPVTERPLNESSMISDDRDFESAGTPDQRTANEESSGSFKKEHDLQDQDGSSSFRRILPDHTFHNYHLSELLRREQIKSEPSSETEILLDKSSRISEGMECGSRRTSIQETTDEENSGLFQKEHDLQDQEGSSSSRSIIPHHTFHNYHLSELLRPEQIKLEPSSETEILLGKSSRISEGMECGSERTSIQETTDEENSGLFQKENGLQDQEGSSSSRRIIPHHTFHNYHLSELLRPEQIKLEPSSETEILLGKSSRISEGMECGSERTSIQETTDEENSGLFQKENGLQDQEGSSSSRRIIPHHTFHNYHLSELLRPEQIKSEPSSETEILLDKSSMIYEDMASGSKGTSIQETADEQSSGLLQQKANLQDQADSSSLKGIFSTETFHNYFTSKPLKLMQIKAPSTNRSIIQSSISNDRHFGSRQIPDQGITNEESSGLFQQKASLQGQEESSSLKKIVLVDTFHNYFSSKPSRAKKQTKSSRLTKRSLGVSNLVSNDRDFRPKSTMDSIYNNEIEKTDALYQFFKSMYYTTKTLPRSLQMKVQKTIFDVVLEEEESVGNI